ncbi:AN1-type zinc finger protein 1 isoform X3 [Urocitellus parryii]|uniref:AN1-type zinc finger protein 1 isoform X3 n=1 Tax=Urocitellus parryii TaxID=9999 RepID=UPI000E560E4F|nr:AN1-type zinc finger protein 1 isoform X3 [Urocitellus parryii]
MAELDIGQHCQVEHCRQRDFLPFVCDSCSGIFCLEHRSKESHGCPEVTIINERLKTDKHKSYPCSFKNCVEKELVAVICPYCEKNFCLRHRHQSDHECEKLEIQKPRMANTQKLVKDIIDSKTGETASKRRKGAKNSETAAKVALMKLKMHADGDKSLPQKLRLCHITSGEALPLDHALETWITKEDCPLYNGGNIILEYLSDEEQSLKNVDSYLE